MASRGRYQGHGIGLVDDKGRVAIPNALRATLQANAPRADGKDGEAGRDGIDGQDGAPGDQGPQGEAGADGKDGSNGVDVLEQCFEKGDVEAAAQEAIRLRYWSNIAESIHGWEKGVGGGLNHH